MANETVIPQFTSSHVGWTARIMIAFAICTAGLFYSHDLVVEHYILASAAFIALVVVSIALIARIHQNKWPQPYRATLGTGTNVLWPWVFTALTGAMNKRHLVRRNETNYHPFSFFKRMVKHYGIILATWWILVGFIELLPIAINGLAENVFGPIFNLVVENWEYTQFGAYAIVGYVAFRLMFSLGSIIILKIRKDLQEKVTQLEGENAELKRQIAAVRRDHVQGNHLRASEIAVAIIALKKSKRGGDKEIGEVRLNLEKVLAALVPNDEARKAMLYSALELFEAREARRNNPQPPSAAAPS